jgi:hypothetical protein
MPAPDLDTLPGFRRRFRITPAAGKVHTEVEDDYHHMGVVLHHADGVVTRVEAVMVRAPWNLCGGAVEQLKRTFTGVPLDGFLARGEKRSNCTHLHDLAMLGAAHAADAAPTVFDILTSDPVDGVHRTELRRNGRVLLAWGLKQMHLTDPPELAGVALLAVDPMAVSSDPALQEGVRLLKWGTMISHGRLMGPSEHGVPDRFVGLCYVFQPENLGKTHRRDTPKDFSAGGGQPLDQPALP